MTEPGAGRPDEEDQGSEPPRGAPRVVLIGMMGSGKTTVGALAARALRWRHVDTDAEVEQRAGRPIAELWRTEGEPRFREMEHLVLAEVLRGEDPAVVSVGGGAVLDPANSAALGAAGTVVWLRAGLDTLLRRVGADAGRPLLGDDPLRALEGLEAQRRPLYEAIATVTLDVDGRSPEQLAHEVAALVVPSGSGS